MMTIVILAAFLMAASATPVEDNSSIITEDPSTRPSVHPPDIPLEQNATDDTIKPPSNNTGGHDAGPPPVDTPEERPTSDTVQPWTDLPSPPPTEDMTPPPDGDPFDCNVTHPREHIYLNCSFVCGGDEAVEVTNGAPCSLNHTEIPTEDYNSTASNETVTGVCLDGQCVPKPTTVAEPTTESSTATTTTTTNVSETNPQSTTSEPTTTTAERTSPESPSSSKNPIEESTSPESTTSSKNSAGETVSPESHTSSKNSVDESASPEKPSAENALGQRDPSPELPGPQSNNTPVAMP